MLELNCDLLRFHGRTPLNSDFVTQTSATRNPGSSHPPRDNDVAARSDMNMGSNIETRSDFTQLQLFDIDLLANKTDMISGYLMDIFPPMDYQQPMIEGVSDAGLGSNSLGIPTLRQNEMPSSQGRASVVQSVSSQAYQTHDSISRSLDAIDDIVATNPWTISAAAVLPEPFTLPSRQTLSRYDKTPMLVLTLAATGSFYGFEHTHGYAMYFIAKSIITHELERRRRASTLHLLRTFPRYAGLPTVLVLTIAWLDGTLAQDVLAMSSQLTELTREALKHPVPEVEADNWRAWAHEEERRRTLFSAYFVINIPTICLYVPPQITSSEVNIPLPSSEAEFKAATSNTWLSLRQKSNSRQPDFQVCLQQLLSGKPLAKEHSATEFGNYMLVQSLLMQVYFERQVASAIPSSSTCLSLDTVSLYENAYSAWRSCWDSAIESALDPHLNIVHSHHLDQEVFHAICALRIPVRVGIAFVARGRTGHWSVQHAISNFACALLLTHWLENLFHLVSSDGIEVLRYEEKRLLSIVERLIEETHLEGSLSSKNDYPRRIRRLAIAAVSLWAETCKGIQVFEIVHVVGETLSLVAESLEGRFQA
ncbi:hypothetical protein V8C34DRAFT_318094 [Trichoderma compactum]